MVDYVPPFTITNKMLDYVSNIMDKLGIKSKETLRSTYLDPAIKEGVIALTISDKPTSKNQMYYKV